MLLVTTLNPLRANVMVYAAISVETVSAASKTQFTCGLGVVPYMWVILVSICHIPDCSPS
jgi:hypothetical protein